MKGIKKEIRDRWYLRWILVCTNWLFQGVHHLDFTEKIYRIVFTIVSSLIVYYSLRISIIYSTIIGHTLNWLVNSNFYNIFIHRLMISKLSKTKLFDYSQFLQKRLAKQNWILYAASFGSICRGKLKDSSDLDISIVRKPGFVNGLKGLWFILIEKKIGDFNKIPLELYLNDNPQTSINRFKSEINPVVMYDKYNVIKDFYQDQLSLKEAKKVNNVL